MRYSSKEKTLTKEYIIDIVKRNRRILMYFPDENKIKYLPRKFILSIIRNVDEDKYLEILDKENELIEKKLDNLRINENYHILPENKELLESLPYLICKSILDSIAFISLLIFSRHS